MRLIQKTVISYYFSRLIACVLLLCPWPHAVAAEEAESLSADAVLARTRLLEALPLTCEAPLKDRVEFGEQLDATVKLSEVPQLRGPAEVTRWLIEYSDLATIRLDFIRVQSTLRQVVLRYVLNSNSPAASAKPLIEIMANSDCGILRGREIVYQHDKPASLVALDSDLVRGTVRDPFDPPFREKPDLVETKEANERSERIAVAVVDSGVDYRSERLATRLHRDGAGVLIGYDYWDDDALPFDSNPARTPFYPQRHGTRIANIIIEESELAAIAPYRYPRTEPDRFVKLIDHVAANDIRIVNLSMGSKARDVWEKFEQASRERSNILFVVSAGNDGINIDDQPIYPAAFDLDNILTVTSSLSGGELAEGSNWGSTGVDILVEGEEILTYGFADRLRMVSGSSYAVARVSALASCLLAANPEQSAIELKEKILALASQPDDPKLAVTRFGYVPLSATEDRGSCVGESEQIVEINRSRILEPDPEVPGVESFGLPLTAVLVNKSGWNSSQVRQTIENAVAILKQCKVRRGAIDLVELSGPRSVRLMSDDSMRALAEFLPNEAIRVFFVEETLREIEFGAEAIGRVNARRRPWLRDSVWMTRWVPDPGYSLAHELFHVLADSGLHRKEPNNLMAEVTGQQDTDTEPFLSPSQCGQLRNIGLGNNLLERPEG